MRRVFPLVFACAMAAAGCEKTGAPTPVPTPIAAPTTVEMPYTGTLLPLGSNLHEFAVQTDGEVDVTLTSETTVPVPDDPTANPPVVGTPATPVTTPLTLAVGTPSITTLGVTCLPYKLVVTAPSVAPQLTGQALKGTYCISISDPAGALAGSVNYTITVAHS
jgi:hypothetical protein